MSDCLLAIDPGPEFSAWVLYRSAGSVAYPIVWAKEPNETVLERVSSTDARLVVEMVASYGMPVGAEVFETCVWTGRFIERWLAAPLRATRCYGPDPLRVYRRDVKLHLCGSPRAKDSHIRQALIDRFGPGKERAVGVKANPGPLYGMKADCWQALAAAITADETMLGQELAA